MRVNKIKGAVIMADGKQVTAADLGIEDAEAESEHSLNLREVRQRAESKAIRTALMKNFGNISRAAEQLGVTRPTLYDLLNKYGLCTDEQITCFDSVWCIYLFCECWTCICLINFSIKSSFNIYKLVSSTL